MDPIILATLICGFVLAVILGIFVDKAKDGIKKKEDNTISSDDDTIPDIVFLCYSLKQKEGD